MPGITLIAVRGRADQVALNNGSRIKANDRHRGECVVRNDVAGTRQTRSRCLVNTPRQRLAIHVEPVDTVSQAMLTALIGPAIRLPAITLSLHRLLEDDSALEVSWRSTFPSRKRRWPRPFQRCRSCWRWPRCRSGDRIHLAQPACRCNRCRRIISEATVLAPVVPACPLNSSRRWRRSLEMTLRLERCLGSTERIDANPVAGRSVLDLDSVGVTVADRGGTGRVRADEIARDHVVRGAPAFADHDPAVKVAGESRCVRHTCAFRRASRRDRIDADPVALSADRHPRAVAIIHGPVWESGGVPAAFVPM